MMPAARARLGTYDVVSLLGPEVFRAWIQELKAMGVKRLEDETAKASSSRN